MLICLQSPEYENSHGLVTKEEAVEYLKTVLEIPEPVTMREQNAYDLLCEVQRRTRLTQPFNNVIYLQEGIKAPSQQENKDIMKKKQGGGCLCINSFTRAVLEVMGYEVYNPGASFPKERTTLYETHLGLVAKNVTHEGSLHLVEPGTVRPIVEPIPLDFHRVSPIYRLITSQVRLFKDCPTVVKLCTPVVVQSGLREDANIYMEEGQAWRALITYHLNQPPSLETYYKISAMLSSNPEILPGLMHGVFIMGFSGNLWTEIRGNTFIRYDKDGRNIYRKMESDGEIIDTARKYFPQYSESDLKRAIDCCRNYKNSK